ncbi:hypothetical protein Cgig2_017998 [Carnegiea gigantea]|uniref:Lipoyl synthase N-terminal domain-containing protein n=1 Tax=Carnegiea gigantea TaxID=171969 RepID=A0A9Q1GLN9_9CARY|nr:hypothetical protein Cgig2_017998 [Carnegiea gigantea]
MNATIVKPSISTSVPKHRTPSFNYVSHCCPPPRIRFEVASSRSSQEPAMEVIIASSSTMAENVGKLFESEGKKKMGGPYEGGTRLGLHTRRDPNVKKLEWLRQKAPQVERFEEVKGSFSRLNLHTVCEEAQCPNIEETSSLTWILYHVFGIHLWCWNGGGDGIATATIMLLTETCTHGCRFSAVKTSRNPTPPDPMEPKNIAKAIASWGYVQSTV